MGSLLGNIGNAVKKAGHQVGSTLNNPWVKGLGTAALAASGVGLPLAAAIGAGSGALGGALRPGGGLKGAITEGGQGALLGAGGSLAGTAGRAALGAIHGGAGVPGLPSVGGVAKAALPAVAGEGGGLGGLLGKAGDFITGNGGMNALGLAQGLNAAMLGKQSSDYAQQAMGDVQHSYDERAPLRALGLNKLTNPVAPDMSKFQQVAGANPFAPRTPAIGLR